MQILAATDFSTRSNRALRQAGLLAQPAQAHLHLLHVVDDDQPEELVRMEEREAERVLAEQMASMPELQGTRCRPMVVKGDPFDGILRAATKVGANLVVMGTHRKHLLLDIFVGTTIERVIRNGSFPVLMVNNEAQRRYENVVAAVDLSDASANALRVALSSGLIGDAGATLLHAFLAQADVAAGRQRAMDDLAAFLVAHDLGRHRWSLSIQEGQPIDIISHAVSEIRPDLLVMGMRTRPGVLRALIGSTTEAALRSLDVDILAAPQSIPEIQGRLLSTPA